MSGKRAETIDSTVILSAIAIGHVCCLPPVMMARLATENETHRMKDVGEGG